jgi:type IV pilus assembly protein PilC
MARRSGQIDWINWAGGLAFSAAVIVLLQLVSASLLIWVTPMLVMIVTVMIWRIRRQRAQRLLGYLNHAVSTGQPIVATLEAAEMDEAGGMGRGLWGLIHDLRGGESLSASLMRNMPEVNQRELNLIAVGERTGRLSVMLHRLTHSHARGEMDRNSVGDPGLTTGAAATILCTSFFMFGLAGYGFMALIVPKFQRVFSDFGRPLPVDLPYPGSPGWAVLTLIVGALGALGVAAMLMAFTGARIATGRWPNSWRWLVDPMVWHLPIFGGMLRGRALSDLCKAAAEGVKAGLPLHHCVREAGQSCGNRMITVRAARWAGAMEGGASIGRAALNAGLPRMIGRMLESANHTEAAGRTLDFLADYYDGRFSRITELLRGTMIPLLVLMQALLVGLLGLWLVRCTVAILEATMAESGLWGAM